MKVTTKYNSFSHVADSSSRAENIFAIIINKFGRYILNYKYIFCVFIFFSILLSPQLSSLAQAPNNASAKAINNNFGITRNETENYYLNTVNQLRLKKGLRPLIIDSRLSISAKNKAQDMQNNKYWGHYAPVGKSFADFIWTNSPNAESVGENLAKCYTSKQEAFNALVASPTHYAIMTGDFSNFGVSEITNSSDGCVYTIMHFSQYK